MLLLLIRYHLKDFFTDTSSDDSLAISSMKLVFIHARYSSVCSDGSKPKRPEEKELSRHGKQGLRCAISHNDNNP